MPLRRLFLGAAYAAREEEQPGADDHLPRVTSVAEPKKVGLLVTATNFAKTYALTSTLQAARAAQQLCAAARREFRRLLAQLLLALRSACRELV